MKTISIPRTRELEKSTMLRTLRLTAALVVAASVACPTAWAQAPAPAAAPGKSNRPQIEQRTFASADEASAALAEAMRTDDARKVFAVLGPGSGKLIYTGDKVADQRFRERFVAAWEKAHKFDSSNPARLTLLLGENDYPFPFPLVQEGSKWKFDAKAGAEEIVDRRIGRNELAAIQVCLAYVDAQREYYAQPRKQGEVLEYAQHMASTAGKRDGLYWEAKAGEPLSPLGPLVAKARAEGYRRSETRGPTPYHGYYYRILTGQGPDAPGGAEDYVARGHMIGGFGLVAFPANYGVSGVMTFIVNHDGVVYEKDLGPSTAARAQQMKLFNPDAGWKKVTPN
jgi:hypothetical protein